MIPYELEQVLNHELEPRERVTWSGQPRPLSYAKSMLPIFIFAIPWTLFSLFWITAASGFKIPDFSGPESFFPLFGLPFVLIGFAMLSAPYFKLKQAKNVVYAVTDRRVIEMVVGKRLKVSNYGADDIGTLKRIESRDGSGTLHFARKIVQRKRGTSSIPIGFFGVDDVRGAESAINQLKRAN